MLDLDYANCLSDRALVELAEGECLDRSAPYLPEHLARTDALSCLGAEERLLLNQLIAAGWAGLSAQLDAALISVAVHDAQASLFDAPAAARALIQVADEAFARQQLTEGLAQRIAVSLGIAGEIATASDELAATLTARGSMAARLACLHVSLASDWQARAGVDDRGDGDPRVAELLALRGAHARRHARVDALELRRAAAVMSDGAIDGAIHDYLWVCDALDRSVSRQVDIDLKGLVDAHARVGEAGELAAVRRSCKAAYRALFVGAGMLHPELLATVREIAADGAETIERRAKGSEDEAPTYA